MRVYYLLCSEQKLLRSACKLPSGTSTYNIIGVIPICAGSKCDLDGSSGKTCMTPHTAQDAHTG